MDIRRLLGAPPSAHVLARYLSTLAAVVPASDALVPDVRSYPDIVYFNYVKLGVSFQFAPLNGYRPAIGLGREQLQDGDLQLAAVDIYNLSREHAFSTYPCLPVELPSETITARPTLASDTTGKEFASWLGEPNRKGGGAGPSTGSIHIWCEWTSHGIMVEFGGSRASGPQAWERGKDAVWRVLTVFPVEPLCKETAVPV